MSAAKKLLGAWYAQPDGKAHEHVAGRVTSLRKELSTYRNHALFLMQLRAGSEDIAGDGLYRGEDGRLRYNLGSSTVDTAGSIVASSRPLPQVVTKGGNWKLQRKGKLRTRTLQTQALELDLYQKAAQAFDDACTIGLGALHFLRSPDTGLPDCERVQPLELVWDRTEANAGAPRSLFRVRLVNREVLMALYPEHAEALKGSDGPTFQDVRDFALVHNSDCDQVVVYEAWHLPSSSKLVEGEDGKKRSKDGKHAICTSNVTLAEEDWKRARFPFAFFRWAPRQFGFVGRSLIEEVRPAQSRIHALIEFVEECQDLGSVPRVWLELGSQVEPDEMDNLPMGIGWYKGNPPIINTHNATPHDLQEEIDRIREQTWSMLGLTQAQIQGEKPAGVTSAIGMRTVEDIGSRRHAQNLKFFEQSMLGCFQALSDVNDDVADADPSFTVARSTRGRFLETSKWAELRIDEGEMRISVFPISSLPTTPAGRYQQIEEWVQAGWMPRDVAMQLLGLPDLEAYEDLNTADLRCAQWQVQRILDGEKNVLPVPRQGLLEAADFGRKSYVNAMQEGAPADVLDQLGAYIDYAKKLMSMAAANDPTAGAQVGGPMSAQARPAPMAPGPAEQPVLAA